MPNGCQKCWQEFKGWLKAFTPIETFLTILEAILLVLLIIFIVFLILHFLSCRGSVSLYQTTTVPPERTTKRMTAVANVSITSTTVRKSRPTCTYTKVKNTLTTLSGANQSTDTSTTHSTAPQDDAHSPTDDETPEITTPAHPDEIVSMVSDGELADEDERAVVLALVKVKPSGVTFGCILTVVSEEWTITAASCLDSIEEVDSLDNFVIIDNYDKLNKGRSHPVTDVRVHPLYEGGNKSHDLALLRCEQLSRATVMLPSLLDYFKLAMGEAGIILGFGKFRTIDHSAPQRVHSATVHILPSSQCAPPDSMERHLVPLAPVTHGSCARGPLCLGVLHARGSPCNYCAGAPLLRRRVLLGVMADNEQCGAACEPAQYANVADARDWIEQVIAS